MLRLCANAPPQLVPRHDPNAPDAVVLQRPADGAAGVPVVLDPYLATKLRPHQIEAVQFMWNCGECGDVFCFTCR